jgi:putative transposase
MARAKRHFLPGYLWHVTHRCHKREFLLKFSRDRDSYLRLLFEARKEFGLSVLNYMVTCNHVHLLVTDGGNKDIIPRSMHLIAGRSAQEYNRRKGRKGAFWEDRYHATAIGEADHLVKCMVYIDLNMVRAGVVTHPSQWKHGGYREIQEPRQRYRLIDRDRLLRDLSKSSYESLREDLRKCVTDALRAERVAREALWTQSIAVGSRGFVEKIRKRLEVRANGRRIRQEGDHFHLREPQVPYMVVSGLRKETLRPDNAYLWQ